MVARAAAMFSGVMVLPVRDFSVVAVWSEN